MLGSHLLVRAESAKQVPPNRQGAFPYPLIYIVVDRARFPSRSKAVMQYWNIAALEYRYALDGARQLGFKCLAQALSKLGLT